MEFLGVIGAESGGDGKEVAKEGVRTCVFGGTRIRAGRGDTGQAEGARTWAEPGELVLGGASLPHLLSCFPSF